MTDQMEIPALVPVVEVEMLRAQVAALTAEVEPARYSVGPKECAEDGFCDECMPEDGDRPPGFCSHVEMRTARWIDVFVLGRLEHLIKDVQDLARYGVEQERSAIAAEILETIQTQVYSLIADLPNHVVDEVGEKALLAKPLYLAALEAER